MAVEWNNGGHAHHEYSQTVLATFKFLIRIIKFTGKNKQVMVFLS